MIRLSVIKKINKFSRIVLISFDRLSFEKEQRNNTEINKQESFNIISYTSTSFLL